MFWETVSEVSEDISPLCTGRCKGSIFQKSKKRPYYVIKILQYCKGGMYIELITWSQVNCDVI